MRGYGFLAFGGPEQEAFLDVPTPEAGPGELLVAVRAAGVNPGDHRMRSGDYDIAVPAVLGREVAGTVVAVGPEVAGVGARDVAVGDEVFGGCADLLGGWAEHARVPAGFAAHRPATVSPEAACVLPVAAGTASDALDALDLPAGATLLINGGGGGVGVPAVQLARARGLEVVTTASPAKHALLAGWGARPVAYGDGVAERIAAAAPDGVDAVFDLVGGDALRTVAGLLTDRRRLISVADKALGVELGGRELVRDRSTTVLTRLVALVADGRIDPHVTEVRPLDDAAAALALVEHGHVTGKVVLAP